MYHLPTKIEIGTSLKTIRQKANFERDYMKLHSCCINIKVGAKGLNWCYIFFLSNIILIKSPCRFGILASTEAALRLDLNFCVSFCPLRLKDCQCEVWWPELRISTLRIIEKNIFHIVHTFAPVCARVRTFAYRWICRRADIRKFFVSYLQFGWSKAQSFFDHELRREVLKVTLLFSFLLTKWFFCLISSCFEIFW